MSSYRKIASHYTLTPDGFLRSGVVTVDSDGTIVGVEAVGDIDSCSGVEFYGGVLIPGMVNAHTHLELSYMQGAVPRGTGFAGFARTIREVRDKFTGQEKRRAAELWQARMWAEGTGAAGDISNGSDTFDLKGSSPINFYTFLEAYGLKLRSLGEVADIAHKASSKGLKFGVTPHSAYSLNEQFFREAVDMTPDGVLSIHFMESLGEGALFRGRGEMKRWYDSEGFDADFIGRYRSAAERIVENIPAHRHLILVHNTHITRSDVALLAEHFGDNLTFVLCPRSNVYITGDTPPVDMLRRYGVRIAVGTDSLASNTDLSIVEELKRFEGVPLEESLRWATANGAEALGLSGSMGTLEKGKRPGVVLLEGVDMENMRLTERSSTRRLV